MQYSLEPLSFQEQQKEKQEKTMRKETPLRIFVCTPVHHRCTG